MPWVPSASDQQRSLLKCRCVEQTAGNSEVPVVGLMVRLLPEGGVRLRVSHVITLGIDSESVGNVQPESAQRNGKFLRCHRL